MGGGDRSEGGRCEGWGEEGSSHMACKCLVFKARDSHCRDSALKCPLTRIMDMFFGGYVSASLSATASSQICVHLLPELHEPILARLKHLARLQQLLPQLLRPLLLLLLRRHKAPRKRRQQQRS